MFILVGAHEEYTGIGNIIIFSVLDTKDGVVENYTADYIQSLSIDIVGINKDKTTVIIDESKSFMDCSTFITNMVFFVDYTAYTRKLTLGVYAKRKSKVSYAGLEFINVLVDDLPDFIKYLNSIGKYIRYDKNFTKQRLLHCVHNNQQYRGMSAKLKLLCDNVKVGFNTTFSLVDYNIALMTIILSSDIDLSYFNVLLNASKCKYCIVKTINKGYSHNELGVVIPVNKFLTLYSGKFISMEQLDFNF